MVLESMNQSIMANLESIIENTGSRNLFRTVSAESGGVIVYSIDGYEDLTADTVTPSDFDKNKYTKTNLKAQKDLVKAKHRYDAAAATLKDLLDKRDALRQKKLLDAIAQSGRSYEEIMQYLHSKSEEA